ncbi:MAG: glycosyltransferase [Isosphaeraceae bacterium]|nr:glycosyltransferase [Isosphaeraceae bacterium]
MVVNSAGVRRILLIAYSFEPDVGSEKGVGWIWARMLAEMAEVTVIIAGGPNDSEAIAIARRNVAGADRFRIVEVPVQQILGRDLKSLPVPGADILRYAAWQYAARRAALRMVKSEHFDLVWHVTWSTGWLGSIGATLGLPFVFGPIAGGVGPPWRLVPSLGPAGIAREVLRSTMRGVGPRVNPLARASFSRASLILTQNADTIAWLPSKVRSRAVLFPNIVLEDLPGHGPGRQPGTPPTALFAGRVHLWKGPHLAIEAIAQLDGWRLLVCGVGPATEGLRRRAARLGVSDRVEFLGWMARDRLLQLMREADVLLFPSLHDEGGWVVSEALASGLPVICLDRGGPQALGGTPVRSGTERATVERLAQAVREVEEGVVAAEPRDFVTRTAALKALLEQRGILPTPGVGDPPSTARR